MSELESDTITFQIITSLLCVAGIVLAIIETPQFHHGLMIGMGSVLPLMAAWRKRALKEME